MKDARWLDVADDIRSAAHHFNMAGRLYDAGDLEGNGFDPYRNRMAFLQAMQSGCTSLEGALERILDILSEEKPSGSSYHADLIRRVAREFPGRRPAIITADLAEAIDETRRFRHVARKNYNNFRVLDAGNAVAAGRRLADRLENEIETFRDRIDPA
ncbi:hypothetical protein [Jiella avicenniae]|uniref:HepT-like domain-containing protein n=1 Tax=Jiella avicenniae TaxID=2907202 RepID=A0A9X1P105_9HYPH|nr:hypothetical protein [Jiella avicenniae]MCE7027814.1 hypothetical protein [Jiella avicenniae]